MKIMGKLIFEEEYKNDINLKSKMEFKYAIIIKKKWNEWNK